MKRTSARARERVHFSEKDLPLRRSDPNRDYVLDEAKVGGVELLAGTNLHRNCLLVRASTKTFESFGVITGANPH